MDKIIKALGEILADADEDALGNLGDVIASYRVTKPADVNKAADLDMLLSFIEENVTYMREWRNCCGSECPYVIDAAVRLTRGGIAAGVNVLRAKVDINGRIVVSRREGIWRCGWWYARGRQKSHVKPPRSVLPLPGYVLRAA
jgi:hypothetical protein